MKIKIKIRITIICKKINLTMINVNSYLNKCNNFKNRKKVF